MLNALLTRVVALTLCMTSSVVLAENLPSGNAQPAASAGSGVTWTRDLGGWRLIGYLVDTNNRLACGLALASGRCMFTCGPGSPRCEGGTHALPFGAFDLSNLPTEPDGTISLQTFVFGSMPGRQVIDPSGGGGGGGGGSGQARWTAYTTTCCPSGSTTFSVTIDGVTKKAFATRCDDPTPTTREPLQYTSAGTKSFSSLASSPCGSFTASGTFEFSEDSCYQITRNIEDGKGVIVREPISCSSSRDVNSLSRSAVEPASMGQPEDQPGNPELPPYQEQEQLKNLPKK